jgi:co-chaperonin GroES (HSP10)
MKKLKPLQDYALVEVVQPAAETESGLLLPERSMKDRDGLLFGIVVAVGPNSQRAIGDVVVFGEYDGEDVVFEGQEYELVKDEFIYAIVSESE